MAVTMDEVRDNILKVLHTVEPDDPDYYDLFCNVPVPEEFGEDPMEYDGYMLTKDSPLLSAEELERGRWRADVVSWGAVSGECLDDPVTTVGDAVRAVAVVAACNDHLEGKGLPKDMADAYRRACDSLASDEPDMAAVEMVRNFGKEAFAAENLGGDFLPTVGHLIAFSQDAPGAPIQVEESWITELGSISRAVVGIIPEEKFKAGILDGAFADRVFAKPVEAASAPRP